MSVSLPSGGSGGQLGSTVVTPSQNTTYTLDCSNAESQERSISSTTVNFAVAPTRVLTTITVYPSNTYMLPGTTMTFTATGYDQYGDVMPINPYWTSSSFSPATVNPTTGVVTAQAGSIGSEIITAFYDEVSGNANVTVTSTQSTNQTSTLPKSVPVITPTSPLASSTNQLLRS